MIMNFAVYSRDGCPYCDQVKQILSGKGYNYREYVLDRNFTREDFNREFGIGSTFPQVLLNDKKLGGCTDTIKYLREQNFI
jgi:glutaredoxin